MSSVSSTTSYSTTSYSTTSSSTTSISLSDHSPDLPLEQNNPLAPLDEFQLRQPELEDLTQRQTTSLPLVQTTTASTRIKKAIFKIQPDEMEQLTTERFADLLIHQTHDTSVTFWGKRLLKESQWLGWEGPHHILYQETGAPPFGAPRVYMVANQIETQTSAQARVSWQLLDNWNGSEFTGPWADRLNELGLSVPSSAIWTPYNEGYWELDRDALEIRYCVKSDPGGRLNFNLNGALLTYPNHVAHHILGLSGNFVIDES